MTWAVVAIGVGLCVLAVVGYIIVKYVRIILRLFLGVHTVRPPRPHQLDGEPVTFRSLDGLPLHGVFLPARSQRPPALRTAHCAVRTDCDAGAVRPSRPCGTVVFCHEFGADGTSVADFARFLRERFNLFTFDFRGHGQSPREEGARPPASRGRTPLPAAPPLGVVTAGKMSALRQAASGTTRRHSGPHHWPSSRDVDDVLGAIAYVSNRAGSAGEPVPVGLFGVSRGGAAAICAAAEIGRFRRSSWRRLLGPSRRRVRRYLARTGQACPAVGAVVVDGACSTRLTLHAYMRRWIGIYSDLTWVHRHLPNWVYAAVGGLTLLVAQARLRRRFPSVLRAIRELAGVPVFIIHGGRDAYIDSSQAEVLFERAHEPKRLWIIPGAGHNQSVVEAADTYAARVTDFFAAHLIAHP